MKKRGGIKRGRVVRKNRVGVSTVDGCRNVFVCVVAQNSVSCRSTNSVFDSELSRDKGDKG